MANLSNYLQNAVLNHLKGTTFPAAPAAVYMAFFNGDPTDAATGGTEVTTSVRAAGRLSVTFGAIASGSISNSAIVDFGNAAAGVTFTHVALFDAASGGNMLLSTPVTGQPIAVSSGTDVNFPVGSFSITPQVGSLTTYAINALLGWFKGAAYPASPAAMYMALFNGDPTGSGTEVTSTIRAAGRLAVPLGAISGNNTISNSAIVDFGNAAAAATFTHDALFDAASGGNMWRYGPVTGQPIAVSSGTDVNFPVGSYSTVID